jgi:hypothetical protein
MPYVILSKVDSNSTPSTFLNKLQSLRYRSHENDLPPRTSTILEGCRRNKGILEQHCKMSESWAGQVDK